MKTAYDIYIEEIEYPCVYCKYLVGNICKPQCRNLLLCYMVDIAEDMILKGEYYG